MQRTRHRTGRRLAAPKSGGSAGGLLLLRRPLFGPKTTPRLVLRSAVLRAEQSVDLLLKLVAHDEIFARSFSFTTPEKIAVGCVLDCFLSRGCGYGFVVCMLIMYRCCLRLYVPFAPLKAAELFCLVCGLVCSSVPVTLSSRQSFI